ncbi:MAG: sugar phosphate nucleotidyltransferase [Steroidobacteraceae bacterium]
MDFGDRVHGRRLQRADKRSRAGPSSGCSPAERAGTRADTAAAVMNYKALLDSGKADPWVVVLAGGEGTRLHCLTKTSGGIAVPKQYCSLQGGPSLIQRSLQRALSLASQRRVCTVVAAQHRMWRAAQLARVLDDNVVEQPENRGTAHGVLLALLHILARDAEATVLLLPADHHVRDEARFIDSLRQAAQFGAAQRTEVFLLGVEPDEPDMEFGYIVPARRNGQSPSRVVEFVEKPLIHEAQSLIARGALWNTFILAASARALLALFGGDFDSIVIRMLHAVQHSDYHALKSLYRTLPSLDFCRDVLEGQEARLQVYPLPPCGWTDLGTPQRVARTVQRLPGPFDATGPISDAALGLDLAFQHWRFEDSRRRTGAHPLAQQARLD